MSRLVEKGTPIASNPVLTHAMVLGLRLYLGVVEANLHLLNLALAMGDAVVVMPAYESMSLAGQIVVGGMFFQEFHALDATGHLWFWAGVAIVVVGILMVSRPEPEHPLLRWVVIGSKVQDCTRVGRRGDVAAHSTSASGGGGSGGAILRARALGRGCLGWCGVGDRWEVTASLKPRVIADALLRDEADE